MSDRAEFSHAWEQFPCAADMPEARNLFFAQASDIAAQTDELVRPAIEAMGGANGYADSHGLQIRTNAVSPWALARTVLQGKPAEGEASLALWHSLSESPNGPPDITRLALCIGKTGVYYSNLGVKGRIVRAGLTVFEGVRPAEMPSDVNGLREMDEAIVVARNFKGIESLPGLSTHVNLEVEPSDGYGGGATFSVQRRLPRRVTYQQHRGLEQVDLDGMEGALRAMGTVLREVAGSVERESQFRADHPRLSARMSNAGKP